MPLAPTNAPPIMSRKFGSAEVRSPVGGTTMLMGGWTVRAEAFTWAGTKEGSGSGACAARTSLVTAGVDGKATATATSFVVAGCAGSGVTIAGASLVVAATGSFVTVATAAGVVTAVPVFVDFGPRIINARDISIAGALVVR